MLKINGVYCDFLTDTGAERTIVHKILIPEEWWSTIIPTNLTMVVASGTEAPLLGELDCNIELGKHLLLFVFWSRLTLMPLACLEWAF